MHVYGLIVSREAKLGLGRTKDTSVYEERRAESGEVRARGRSGGRETARDCERLERLD